MLRSLLSCVALTRVLLVWLGLDEGFCCRDTRDTHTSTARYSHQGKHRLQFPQRSLLYICGEELLPHGNGGSKRCGGATPAPDAVFPSSDGFGVGGDNQHLPKEAICSPKGAAAHKGGPANAFVSRCTRVAPLSYVPRAFFASPLPALLACLLACLLLLFNPRRSFGVASRRVATGCCVFLQSSAPGPIVPNWRGRGRSTRFCHVRTRRFLRGVFHRSCCSCDDESGPGNCRPKASQAWSSEEVGSIYNSVNRW